MTDWYEWHRPYADPDSPLAQRLRLVQRHLTGWLDAHPVKTMSLVSMCAGQGHDILDVLAARPDAARIRATLIEYDPRNVEPARARAATLPDVSVRQADAGDLSSYQDAAPADLVLMAGVLGNISDADVRTTIAALPQLCARDATLIWTRSRRHPDLTPAIRTWLASAGFEERAFHAPEGVLFTVGVHHFTGTPRPLTTGRLFTFRTRETFRTRAEVAPPQTPDR